jgi:hypothetical protein
MVVSFLGMLGNQNIWAIISVVGRTTPITTAILQQGKSALKNFLRALLLRNDIDVINKAFMEFVY